MAPSERASPLFLVHGQKAQRLGEVSREHRCRNDGRLSTGTFLDARFNGTSLVLVKSLLLLYKYCKEFAAQNYSSHPSSQRVVKARADNSSGSRARRRVGTQNSEADPIPVDEVSGLAGSSFSAAGARQASHDARLELRHNCGYLAEAR